MRICAWNCRGLGSNVNDPTVSFLVNIVRLYQLEFLFLFETKTTVEKSTRRLHILEFPNSMGVDAEGFAGGIWLSSKNNVDLTVTYYCKNYMWCNLNTVHILSNISWDACFVYREPTISNCSNIWESIQGLYDHFKVPTLLIGDFN